MVYFAAEAIISFVLIEVGREGIGGLAEGSYVHFHACLPIIIN